MTLFCFWLCLSLIRGFSYQWLYWLWLYCIIAFFSCQWLFSLFFSFFILITFLHYMALFLSHTHITTILSYYIWYHYHNNIYISHYILCLLYHCTINHHPSTTTTTQGRERHASRDNGTRTTRQNSRAACFPRRRGFCRQRDNVQRDPHQRQTITELYALPYQ